MCLQIVNFYTETCFEAYLGLSPRIGPAMSELLPVIKRIFT